MSQLLKMRHKISRNIKIYGIDHIDQRYLVTGREESGSVTTSSDQHPLQFALMPSLALGPEGLQFAEVRERARVLL